MSVGQPGPDLAALLERLQTLGPGATRAQLDALFRQPQSAMLEHVRQLAGLVRVLDPAVYRFLTHGTEGAPELTEMLNAFPGDFAPVPSNGWVMRENARDALLAEWQSREKEWREWNTSLLKYYAERKDKPSELEAAYHAAASVDPKSAIAYFEAFYTAADDRADFAHCHALLEALRVQEQFRSWEVSGVYRDKARYLQTRLLFLEALQKSGAYIKREAPHNALASVLQRQTTQPWIFRMHATGGTGKTMMLRWLVARDLVLRRVPCAVVDFDADLVTFVRYPLRLLGVILGQWAQQMAHTVLSSAVALLQGAHLRSDWDPQTLAALRATLQGANIRDEVVIVLDTLEEPTLFHPQWLKTCLAALRELHSYLPRLTMILAGRYDLSRIGPVFEAGESVSYELPRFSRREALAYLTLRRLTDEEMQLAIIERAAIGEVSAESCVRATAPESKESAPLLNPFKLALLTDLVLDHDTFKPDDVRQLPNVDIAYLIERVIIRIPSQPLRWVVRYGAVARALTISWMEHVLLPPLKDALRGRPGDLSSSHLSSDVRKYLDSKVTWTRNPELADSLSAEGLWNELKAYTRERGWISTGDTEDVLHLHPEVTRPMQILLSEEPVYRTLHAASRDFYLARWSARSGSADDPAPFATEAIYHATALDRRTGREHWARLMKEAAPESRYAIATEPTRTSYRDENDRPLYPEWFCEAHIESARVKMHSAGAGFSPGSESSLTFSSHVLAARQQNSASVPALFAALLDDAASGVTNVEKAETLGRTLPSFSAPYDLLWLHIRAAHSWSAAGREDLAEWHWLDAARAADKAGVAEVTPAHVDRTLADCYARQHRYSDAMRLYDGVRLAGVMVADTLERQADLALTGRDLGRARTLLDALETVAPGVGVGVLRLRHLVQTADTKTFFQNAPGLLKGTESNEHLAAGYSLQGEAHRLLMDYRASLEMFSRATDLGDSVDRTSLLAPLSLREIEVCAFDLEDVLTAQQLLHRVTDVVTKRSADDETRFVTVRAFLAARQSRRDEAAALLATDAEKRASPGPRARTVLLGLSFDLFANAAEYSRRLLELLKALDPSELASEVLELLEYVPDVSKSLAPIYTAIRDAVLGPLDGRPMSPFEIPLQMLDLARVCGVGRAEVADRLRVASSALPSAVSTARLRYGLRLLDHHVWAGAPGPLKYADLLAQCAEAGADGKPLQALLKSRTATELAASGNLDAGRRLAEEAVEVWTSQPASRFLAAVTAARDNLVNFVRDPSERVKGPLIDGAQEKAPPSLPSESGATVERLRGLARLSIDQTLAKTLETTFDRLATDSLALKLLNDWRSVQNALVSIIRDLSSGSPSAALQITTPPLYASLPWEFVVPVLGSRLLCRSAVDAIEPMPAVPPENTRVLLIKPRNVEYGNNISFDISEEASSGFSMEHLYLETQRKDYVATLGAPHPDQLQSALVSLRPQVVHIIGQVVESTAGVYVDFEGSDRRIAKVKGLELGARLDASRLVRYLAPVKHAPVVILDITAPENITDVVRMLLLRNRFAAELFQSGAVRAVLATGLTGADERESFARALVSGVHDNTSLAFLWHSIRDDDEPQDLLGLLSHCSSALFAHNPYARILPPATDSVDRR